MVLTLFDSLTLLSLSISISHLFLDCCCGSSCLKRRPQ